MGKHASLKELMKIRDKITFYIAAARRLENSKEKDIRNKADSITDD